jgi:hypothetical protein
VFNLIKQVREEVHILESDCPLYTAAGVPPPTDLDEKVEKDFNDVLRLTNKVALLRTHARCVSVVYARQV